MLDLAPVQIGCGESNCQGQKMMAAYNQQSQVSEVAWNISRRRKLEPGLGESRKHCRSSEGLFLWTDIFLIGQLLNLSAAPSALFLTSDLVA